MTNPRAIDPNTSENLEFVALGLSMLATEYEKQAKRAETLNDDHTKTFCRRRAMFLVLELRPRYHGDDELGNKLRKKMEKRIADEKAAAASKDQLDITDPPAPGGDDG